jgi:hypothetical protein
MGRWEEIELEGETNRSSKSKIRRFFGGLKAQRKILATDAHGHTRTGRFKAGRRGGWEVRKMGSEWKLKGQS